MEYLNKIALFIYAYCTGFIINLANIFNLSYYEINALIFCFVYPLLILLLGSVYYIQILRLKNLKNSS